MLLSSLFGDLPQNLSWSYHNNQHQQVLFFMLHKTEWQMCPFSLLILNLQFWSIKDHQRLWKGNRQLVPDASTTHFVSKTDSKTPPNKTPREKNARNDRENAERDETNGEPMRFRKSQRNKMLTEWLIPSTAQMDVPESHGQKTQPNFAFIHSYKS